nr:hypothetical protein [Sporosarcina limicola]
MQPHQLKRVPKRATIGIGRNGSPMEAVRVISSWHFQLPMKWRFPPCRMRIQTKISNSRRASCAFLLGFKDWITASSIVDPS